MITPIRAIRYRIRKEPSLPDGGATGRSGPGTAAALAAIEAEGLSPRQLRQARRLASSHGIGFASDFEAVLKLREGGIDPVRRGAAANALKPPTQAQAPEAQTPGPQKQEAPAPNGPEPAAPEPAAPKAEPQKPEARKPETSGVRVPQTLPQTLRPPAPPPAVLDEEARVDHIMRIQRDIVRRRRRQLSLLAARLAALVLLPTLIAGLYYFVFATPMYATHSAFVIQQAESTAMGNLGGFFKGTQFATSQDSITVQSYLQSRDAMLRLDKDLGFRAAFSAPGTDRLQRLAPDATTEDAYGVYQNHVKISYDPTEGIIKMEVITPDPQLSQTFAERLIHYAEEQVDRLSLRLRETQMTDARAGYEDAERKVQAAQAAVLELQQKVGVLDPRTETTLVMSQIAHFEGELRRKQLELQALLDNAKPNAARVEGARADIARLEKTVAELRAGLTTDQGGSASLAAVTGQLRIAEGELTSRQLMLAQALAQMETARIEANRQTRYLSMGVSPLAPDAATYPRAFENTVLALLIFSGIYLMLSLTAAILREQVSS